MRGLKKKLQDPDWLCCSHAKHLFFKKRQKKKTEEKTKTRKPKKTGGFLLYPPPALYKKLKDNIFTKSNKLTEKHINNKINNVNIDIVIVR